MRPTSASSRVLHAIRTGDHSLARSPYADGAKSLAAVLAAVHSARNDGAWVDLSDANWAVD